MQHGCMERLNRKRGPEVWQFRWSVTGPDGKRLYHKKIVGTVERYPDENAARRCVVRLVSEINIDAGSMNPDAMTVAQSVIISSNANSRGKTPGAVTLPR
jgi:integrase